MFTGDEEWSADEKQTAVIELLNQADDIHRHVDQIMKIDNSPQSRLEVSKAYAMAAKIYHHAIHLIEADSEKRLVDHDRLAFMAYYGCGISLTWGGHYAYDEEDDDFIVDEEYEDVNKPMEMLYRAVEIANINSLNLSVDQSLAYGIVAEDLEDKGKYEEAYALFQKMHSIYEMQGDEYANVVSLGYRMVISFTQQDEAEGDTSWLRDKAHTAISCLEKIIVICDSALVDEDVRTKIYRPDNCLTSWIEHEKLTAERKLKELKEKYGDSDVGHVDKKTRQVENSTTSLLYWELLKHSKS